MSSFIFLDRMNLGFRSAPRYLRRRNTFLVFALTCKDVSETCFCLSMGTGPASVPGYDVLMTDIGGKYLLEAPTKEGQSLLIPLDLQEATPAELDAKQACLERLKDQFKRSVDRARMVQLVYNNQDHPTWKKIGDICLACGQCVMICPTCFCFYVKDKVDVNLTNRERYREWDIYLRKIV